MPYTQSGKRMIFYQLLLAFLVDIPSKETLANPLYMKGVSQGNAKKMVRHPSQSLTHHSLTKGQKDTKKQETTGNPNKFTQPIKDTIRLG